MGWLLFTIKPIIEPLIIAGLVAYVLNPVVKLMQTRARLSHKWAVGLVYFSGLALLITIPGALAPIAIQQTRDLSVDLGNIEAQIEALLTQPVVIAGYRLHLGQLWADFFSVTNQSLMPEVAETLAVLETTSTGLLWLMVILVSVYYFLLDWEGLRNWFVRLAPDSMQADIHCLLREVDTIWQAYLRGTIVLMIVVGIVFTIAWLAIGLPGAIALGLLMGLLTVIPDIGPMIGALVAVLVAFFKGSDFLPLSNLWFAGLVFAIYFVLIQVKAIWLRPRVMKRFLHLNEGLIFVSIIGATVLWGILGALIIVPLLATLGVIGRYVRCRLLHLDPWADNAASSPPLLSKEQPVIDTEKQDQNKNDSLPASANPQPEVSYMKDLP
jgi:predicted PurR-regulated permease PerM